MNKPNAKRIVFLGAPTLSIKTQESISESFHFNGNLRTPCWRGLSLPGTHSTSVATNTDVDNSPVTFRNDQDKQDAFTCTFRSAISRIGLEDSADIVDGSVSSDFVDQRPDIPPLVRLTDLEDLPTPAAVSGSSPYSCRLTAVVAVLSVSHPRTVSTRFKTIIQKYELVVGDPTCAGFPITVWLQPNPSRVSGRELEAVVNGLEINDVIAIQDINLKVFNGRVVGETVRKNRPSKMWVLHRFEGSTFYNNVKLCWRDDPSRELSERKVARVITWVKESIFSSHIGWSQEKPDSLPQDSPASIFLGI